MSSPGTLEGTSMSGAKVSVIPPVWPPTQSSLTPFSRVSLPLTLLCGMCD